MTAKQIRSWSFKFDNNVTTEVFTHKEATEIRRNLGPNEYETVNYVTPEHPDDWVDKSDWTAKEALAFYAAGRHFDVIDGRTRIIDTGEVAGIALKSIDPQFISMESLDPETLAPDAVVISIELARKVGLLTCKHCGYPKNNHFDWGPMTCAHDGSCPGFSEGIRKDLVDG